MLDTYPLLLDTYHLIQFEAAIKSIDQYAFKTSEYPLILSLENHCNIDQQKKMSDIMVRIFGEKLLKEPIDSNETVHPRSVQRSKVRRGQISI